MKVMVTGANGFVGRALCKYLNNRGYTVVPAVRRLSGPVGETAVGNIDGATDWTGVLTDCNAAVHLAASVHVIDETSQALLAFYRATNTDATLNLARQAAHAGVKRFIFVSTIKVNGEGNDTPYRETDVPAPRDAYAISKWEAEQGLQQIARETGLEVVVLRPPLVYGPGVKANFLRLMQLIQQGWPLPLGAIKNRRSLLYLGNFIDAIRFCIEHPAAPGQTFLVDDGQTISTPDLIREIAKAMHRPARLIPVPVSLLQWVGSMTGRSAAVSRLTGSLYLDSQAIRSRLGWTPPYSMQTGLAQTVAAFIQNGASVQNTVKST